MGTAVLTKDGYQLKDADIVGTKTDKKQVNK